MLERALYIAVEYHVAPSSYFHDLTISMGGFLNLRLKITKVLYPRVFRRD